MKNPVIQALLVPALIAVLNLIPADRATAQTFRTLHSFTATEDNEIPYFPNSDGAGPNGLVLSSNTLYGTATSGGSGGAGTVFAVHMNGTGFTALHHFAPPHYFAGYVPDTNSDGIYPNGLVVSGNTLYGTTERGGLSGNGTLFAVNTDGTSFTNLHEFTPTIADLKAGLILSGNTLYGTEGLGGISGNGTVFAVNTNGTGLTNLHRFTAAHTNSFGVSTNSDGANPQVGLILSGATLYGTASGGGITGNGTVFAVNTNGTGFRVLHSFTALSGGYYGTNSEGANPSAGLILSGHTLYGTAWQGGTSGRGTLFAVNTNGTGFTNLHSFTYSDGANPSAGLILSGHTLYGTSYYGGSSGKGTVFSLSFRPQLTITPSGTNLILSWPTNVAGFDYTGYTLQSSTSLDAPSVWSTNSAAPVVIAGRDTVTNPIGGARQFYRLAQ